MEVLHAGLDLSRRRLDVCMINEDGTIAQEAAVSPDRDALRGLARSISGSEVHAAIESMNGARFVHDVLEAEGWQVAIADAQKTKGLAPLACKTDRIDARVLAELSRLHLVPEIWLPTPDVRAHRERARFRIRLVRHRTSLKNRVHATLLAHGVPCPVSDLFGPSGRSLLKRLEIPEPWATTLSETIRLIDTLEEHIDRCEQELRQIGATHPYVPLLQTLPGVGWVLGYTIAAEIGDITRFGSPKKLVGYSGLCPRVYQSGDRDNRGSISKAGPDHLRWALVEAATTAARHPYFRSRHEQFKRRLGQKRGAKVSHVDIARRLCESIWHMLTKSKPFAPEGPRGVLVA